jgi:dTDP-D-glucose 4,6-dehydratase
VWDPSQPSGQPRRQLDVSRARERFGFRAATPFSEGIARTVAYYEANRLAIEAGAGSGIIPANPSTTRESRPT